MLSQRWIDRFFAPYVPAYMGGTLNPLLRLGIWLWMRTKAGKEAFGDAKALTKAIQKQPLLRPSETLLVRIQAQIPKESTQSSSLPKSKLLWTVPALLLVLSLLILVWTLPPGIVLAWSVEGETPQLFRIYRAPVAEPTRHDLTEYELIREIPVETSVNVYRYLDLLLLPGQDFIYRVEAVDRSGLPAASETLAVSAGEILPGQLLLLMSVSTIGILLFMVARSRAASHLTMRTWSIG